ncbi:hypothetical protein BD626DRAFT_488482 [Schizophyllum amplum]|uniref:choline-phosphate cytidylyltransferase n=1 Tax=Schizophyllum amplum TaxID=97359 RepID=A0A550CKL5_9AGAR|nr:hypothetical protein BD626DRAFT_488482 [Auriculariopsis ampla]
MDASSVLDDLSDYEVISDRSLDSSLADLNFHCASASEIFEPPPSVAAQERWPTTRWEPEDVREFVRRALDASAYSKYNSQDAGRQHVRVYVDGLWDGFNTAHALQLRQAKLAFPSVYLMVGVFSDEDCRQHGSPAASPHVERCEVLRHCRWVDEIISEAPWQLNDAFILGRRIDYVAIDEGTSVDPACDKVRLRGYDAVKSLGKVIPTRRTFGVTRPQAPSRLSTPVVQNSRPLPAVQSPFNAPIDDSYPPEQSVSEQETTTSLPEQGLRVSVERKGREVDDDEPPSPPSPSF